MRLSSPFVPVLLAAFLALSACGREGGSDRAPEPGDRSVAEVQGQTKDRLSSPEAARFVENAVRDHFDHFLADRMDRGKALLAYVLERMDDRLRRKQEREVKRKTATSGKKVRLLHGGKLLAGFAGAAADAAANTKDLRLRQDRLRVFHVAFAYPVLAVAQQDGDVFIGVIDGDAGLDAQQVQGGVAGFEEGFDACGEEGGLVVVFHVCR